VDAIKMELSRHEAKAKAPKEARPTETLAALVRLAKKAKLLAVQVGDPSIVRAAEELDRVVRAKVLAGLPAENGALVDCLTWRAPSRPAVEDELSDEAAALPEAPEGFFDGMGDAEEPAESFNEGLSDEVLP
jgi:hypothetical protein